MLVGACDVPVEADKFGIGEHDAATHHQIVDAEAGTELIYFEQSVALLVGDNHILQHHFVERSDRELAHRHLGVE